MENIVEARGLKRYYGNLHAVDGVDLTVKKGELFGFLGINGAGKSTTINMLCTLTAPTGGIARICGFELGREEEQIRHSIGVVYQNNCLDEKLTVCENLMIRGFLYEKSRARIHENLDYVCHVLDLKELLKRPFGKLSGGQKRRCEIARALMNRPRLLFLDEPTTGLDPATRKTVWDSILALRRNQDMTVFLTTHYMEEAAGASQIAVIDEGRILETGTPFSLKEKYASDKLKLNPKNHSNLKYKLKEKGVPYQETGEFFSLSLKDSMEALPILDAVKEEINGFEMVKGTMDDVFLTITGKELKKG